MTDTRSQGIGLLAAAVTAAALLAGCGGGGGAHLAKSDAAQLIALSNRIATEAPCAQARDIRAVRTRSLQLINAKRVPAELQEPFLSGVNALSARTPVCVPPAPASDQGDSSGAGSNNPASKHRQDNGKQGGHDKGGGD